MTFLALDLGTSTGYAIYKSGQIISGTKQLHVNKRVLGMHFLEFRKWLLSVIVGHGVQHVFFERVYGHTSTEAAHVYGGFMYALATVCLEKNIPCTGFTVQAIKKFMTGKGNATKDEMIHTVQNFSFNPQTDDEADAISIMLLALRTLKIDNRILDKKTNGSFQKLMESERQAPDILLASKNFCNFTLLGSET